MAGLPPGTRVRVRAGFIRDPQAAALHDGRTGTVITDALFDAAMPPRAVGVRAATILAVGPVVPVLLDGPRPVAEGAAQDWAACYIAEALEVLT